MNKARLIKEVSRNSRHCGEHGYRIKVWAEGNDFHYEMYTGDNSYIRIGEGSVVLLYIGYPITEGKLRLLLNESLKDYKIQ